LDYVWRQIFIRERFDGQHHGPGVRFEPKSILVVNAPDIFFIWPRSDTKSGRRMPMQRAEKWTSSTYLCMTASLHECMAELNSWMQLSKSCSAHRYILNLARGLSFPCAAAPSVPRWRAALRDPAQIFLFVYATDCW